MLFEIFVAVIIGIGFGIITGLIPGIHINLVSIMLISLSSYLIGIIDTITLAVFIVSMSVTHTFLDIIPSVFLGAPDSDQALNVLPCHKLLLKGKGFEAVKLATIGSLTCLIAVVIIMPLLGLVVPLTYDVVSPFMGWILLFVVIFMIYKEGKLSNIVWASFIFLMSGVLGMIVLSVPNLKQPLFPMLSGLFGISTLVTSLANKVKIPRQDISETIKVSGKEYRKTIFAGTFSGSLTGIFPGLGAAHAAIIGNQITGEMSESAFIVLVGGINTVNFVFSLVTLYTIDKARNGAVVAVQKIIESISLNDVMVLIASALISGGIATFLAMGISRIFSKVITKVNYQVLCLFIIGFICVMVFYFSSFLGLYILILSSFIGMLPVLLGVKRSSAMGCLMLPVILFFLL